MFVSKIFVFFFEDDKTNDCLVKMRKKRVKQVVVYLRDVEKEENYTDTDKVCLYGQKKGNKLWKKIVQRHS